ncbi:MAG TPA: MraY family glycosyltransferase, partial [Pirellulaceae bacterium]|nr:MraY family glycosyltransferase [Pirellulaceae bacterium]
SFILVLSVWPELSWRADDAWELGALLGAGTLIFIVGLLDDRFGLRGRQKLAGQILAVTILVAFGYQVRRVDLAGFTFEFGTFAFIVVYAWCLVTINSVNLLDGADGFAATVGIVVSVSLSVMALSRNQFLDAGVCLALAGALTGFLWYNFPPAKVYLGDAGSMLIGLVLGAVAIRCSFKQAAAYAFFAPVALLAIPLIDTGAAIVRRRFTGRSIYMEDRGHLHHIMAKQGLSPRISLLWVFLLSATTACGATLAMITKQSEYAIASVFVVIVVMIAGRIFGVAELRLFLNNAKGVVTSFIKLPMRRTESNLGTTVRLQGQRDWNQTWERLYEFAQEHELLDMMLDINAPWMHEGYHAHWRRRGIKSSPSREWHFEVPLIVAGGILGRVKASASRDCRYTHHEIVSHLLKLTYDIELELGRESERMAANEPASEPEFESVAVTGGSSTAE